MKETKIPRRASVIDALASETRPLHQNEIATRLEVAPRHLPALGRVLDDLVLDGTVVPMPGHHFRLAKVEQGRGRGGERGRGERGRGERGRGERGGDASLREGFLNANPRGFGFIAALDGGSDIFVPREAIGGALHGDKVRVRIVAESHRGREGSIEAIVSRRPPLVSGTLRRRGRSAWLEPDDSRVRGPIVLDAVPADAPDGYAVIARITRFPETPDENPEGVLSEVLGPQGVLDVEAKKILATRGIDEAFDPKAEAEAIAYGKEVPAEMLAGREDLTHLPLPTIDPVDARDHDDAVWAVRNDDGSYRVWVAIADVSTYVTEGSAIDASAVARGNSIYLPNRAIPMLPRALSSELCSLLPNKIRLCLAVEIDLDPTGHTKGARVIEGFMRSAAKLTYEGVARALGLTAEPARMPEAEAMREELTVLRDVSGLLRTKRARRGALAFDVPEAQIVLDTETGLPTGVKKRGGDPGVAKAYSIIEELMILANETVAEILVEKGAPAIFRNHGAPDPMKIERFAAMCERFGVPFDVEEMSSESDDGATRLDPKKLAAFVKRLAATSHAPARAGSAPSASILQTLLVRSMKQATYDVANIGHFGLASKAYLHFTSPIRRYPDVVVHRTLRRVARKEPIDKSEAALSAMRDAAMQASTCERRAMEIERETADLYRTFFMKDHLGETYAATVAGFSVSGAYATIDDPFVDVMIRSDSMGEEPYVLDEDGLSMVASRSGDRIDLGDTLLVRVEECSTERRTVYARRMSEPKADGGGAHEPRHKRGAVKEKTVKKTRRTEPSKGRRHDAAPSSGPTSRREKPAKAGDKGKKKNKKR